MKLRKLKHDEVVFELSIELEDVPVRGNFLASGNPIEDLAAEDYVLDQLQKGNTCAWCTVQVTAEWNSFRGIAILGCCSYESEEDLRTDLFEQMKQDALEDLQNNIETTFSNIKPLICTAP